MDDIEILWKIQWLSIVDVLRTDYCDDL